MPVIAPARSLALANLLDSPLHYSMTSTIVARMSATTRPRRLHLRPSPHGDSTWPVRACTARHFCSFHALHTSPHWIHAAWSQDGPSPAVPGTFPERWSAAVTHGQRSVIVPAELHQQPHAGGRRVLPKLAVLVFVGSARHKEPLVLGGHERSTSGNQHRRSEAVHRLDLVWRSSPALGSNPPPPPRSMASDLRIL
jgi:hypothetical protein